MPIKTTPLVGRKPPNHTRLVSTRLTLTDTEVLIRMAKKEGVGISTFARLVLEAYARQHAPKGER